MNKGGFPKHRGVAAAAVCIVAAILCRNIGREIPGRWLGLLRAPRRRGLPAADFVFLLSGAVSFAETVREVKRERTSVTCGSIREAMDDLPAAGCYFTERGDVKLCSRRMYMLYRDVTGRDLQTLSELHAVLWHCASTYGTADGGAIVFPDGRVRQYSERTVEAGDAGRCTESILTDVTELCDTNEALRRKNAELSRVNAELERMYAREAERIREEEYLAFKMKLHDDLGRSLVALRRSLREGASGAETAAQLDELRPPCARQDGLCADRAAGRRIYRDDPQRRRSAARRDPRGRGACRSPPRRRGSGRGNASHRRAGI